jgi:hypothetical protein
MVSDYNEIFNLQNENSDDPWDSDPPPPEHIERGDTQETEQTQQQEEK